MTRYSTPQLRKQIIEMLEAWADKVLYVEYYPIVVDKENIRSLIERVRRVK